MHSIPTFPFAENIVWPEAAGAKKITINQRVTQVAEVLQLATLLERKPKALSGGQRQRVATVVHAGGRAKRFPAG